MTQYFTVSDQKKRNECKCNREIFIVIVVIMFVIAGIVMVAVPVVRLKNEPKYYNIKAKISDYIKYENESMTYISYTLSFQISSQKCVSVRNIKCNVTQECPDKNYFNGTILNVYSAYKDCDYFFKNPSRRFTSGEIVTIIFGVIFMLPLLIIIGMSGAGANCSL